MTDGPYRNLPLNQPWKKAAEALSEAATSIPEACELLSKAAEQDIQDQRGPALIRDLKEAFDMTPQSNLFSSDPLSYIDHLGIQHPASFFNAALIRHAKLMMSEGKKGETGLAQAITLASAETVKAGIQSIREHDSLRKTDQEIIHYTRRRCDEVKSEFDSSKMAFRLLNEAKTEKTAHVDRHVLIDEGPEL